LKNQTNISQAKAQFDALNACVVLPTYNNEKTLRRVIDGVLKYTNHIIVVNDGSSDGTKDILNSYAEVTSFHQKKNSGKGHSLKYGFKQALKLGYNYAITLDTDGQHYPDDIPNFLAEIETVSNKDILIIGDRNMNNANVFAQSAKGNRVSTYWVKAVTGLTLNDSQSGFRWYPIKALSKLKYYNLTKKFEFEVEVIVKAYWLGIDVTHVPINVLYDPTERVSHFRPFWDIARITILIIWFLLVRLFYITPKAFFNKLKKKGLKQFIIQDVLKSHDSPKKKALSVALGLFLGLSPLWGFHTVIVIFLAVVLKLNKVIAFITSNISLPPFIPLVLLLSMQVGNWVLGIKTYYTLDMFTKNFDLFQNLKAYIIGSLVLSTSCALIFGLLSYVLFSWWSSKKRVQHV
jgi:glycosyltransferase involved in cell wall biosynthesis